MERIPWISHHPIDVKRGTFIGEMSRLAVLCSLQTHYKDAIHDLKGLYLKRGYPESLINKWIKDNITKRWNNRLINLASQQAKIGSADQEDAGILVLKSHFNPVWNYFSAKELGETVLGFWDSYLEKQESPEGQRSLPADFNFPLLPSGWAGLGPEDASKIRPEYLTSLWTSEGKKPMPDVRKIGITKKKIIVSRKRTRNLFDLASLWKKTVISRFEKNALDPDENIEEQSSDMEIGNLSDYEEYISNNRRNTRPEPGDLEYIHLPRI